MVPSVTGEHGASVLNHAQSVCEQRSARATNRTQVMMEKTAEA